MSYLDIIEFITTFFRPSPLPSPLSFRQVDQHAVACSLSDRLPVVVRFPAGPRVRLKTVDPPKGNGLGQKKKYGSRLNTKSNQKNQQKTKRNKSNHQTKQAKNKPKTTNQEKAKKGKVACRPAGQYISNH